MDNLERLDCLFYRRYGIEIEVNAFDGIARGQNDPPPVGIDQVGFIVNKITKERTEIKTWHHTHNNNSWIIKPDGSAGIEICTPILKGWKDLLKSCRLVHAFKEDEQIQADDRCSLHIHLNTSDLSREQLATVLAYWIKCEPTFMDSVPSKRKLNRYCQLIGVTDLFTHDFLMDADEIIQRLGRHKYTSMNTYHFVRDARPTIEFRIMENDTCTDPFFVKNWVRLMLHFVKRTCELGLPNLYEEGDRWSSLLWLDTLDVLSILGFDGSCELSPGLKQVRNWFLGKLKMNIADTGLPGIWSDTARQISFDQLNIVLEDIKKKEGLDIGKECVYPTDLEEALYSEEYIL
jgi:hypothetical protein